MCCDPLGDFRSSGFSPNISRRAPAPLSTSGERDKTKEPGAGNECSHYVAIPTNAFDDVHAHPRVGPLGVCPSFFHQSTYIFRRLEM